VEDGQIAKNPCRNIGQLLGKVRRQQSDEVEQINAWSRAEVATLLEIASKEEPRFHPIIAFLLSTGCRKGEALALKWEDVDFEGARVSIRRSLSRGQLGTPKSGRARSVVLSPALLRSSTISSQSAVERVSSAAGAKFPSSCSAQRRAGC
jgi:integrase